MIDTKVSAGATAQQVPRCEALPRSAAPLVPPSAISPYMEPCMTAQRVRQREALPQGRRP